MCKAETLKEADFPMEWDWLQHAEYHRFEDHRTNKTYDAWTMHVSNNNNSLPACFMQTFIQDQEHHEELTLLVDESMPTMPAAMLHRHENIFVDERFLSFNATEPPTSVFAVPKECTPPPQ